MLFPMVASVSNERDAIVVRIPTQITTARSKLPSPVPVLDPLGLNPVPTKFGLWPTSQAALALLGMGSRLEAEGHFMPSAS